MTIVPAFFPPSREPSPRRLLSVLHAIPSTLPLLTTHITTPVRPIPQTVNKGPVINYGNGGGGYKTRGRGVGQVLSTKEGVDQALRGVPTVRPKLSMGCVLIG